jgi:hypothetical protein
MAKEAVDFTLPSDPAARKKIKDAIYEMAAVTQEISDKRSYITDTKKMLKEEFSMPPKIASKMAKTVHEHNFRDVVAESEAFTSTYEVLFEGGSVSDEE